MTVYQSSPALAGDAGTTTPRPYAWWVFALTVGLLISDYMSRQILNAVFPLLKSEWALSDSQLGLLSGIVALMVGLLTFPLSLVADRWGRVRSVALMAALWSLATLGCALARDYQQMFAARFLIGVGEAAYGSVGIAVVLSVFPRSMRASLAAAFMAGSMFGSVLGVGLGGFVAAHFGWRWAFACMALFGLLLAVCYPLVVREKRLGCGPVSASGGAARRSLKTLFASRSVWCAYLASGLQLFVAGTLIVWIPSYLHRYFGMGTDRAGAVAAVMLLCSGVGMIVCGVLSDRLALRRPERKASLAAFYCLASCVLLSVAFALPHDRAQLVLLTLGMMLSVGSNGPSSAMVADLTHPAVHGTAFATLTLANNLIGLAPGPLVTGKLSDLIGLQSAFQLIPVTSVIAALVFLHAARRYRNDVTRLGLEPAESSEDQGEPDQRYPFLR